MATQIPESVKDTAESVRETVTDTAESVRERVSDATEGIRESMPVLGESSSSGPRTRTFTTERAAFERPDGQELPVEIR